MRTEMRADMNRRFLLTAASAGLVVPGLVATRAFAESAMKASDMKAGEMKAGEMKAGGTAAAEDYAMRTLHIGSFSKAISEMAGQKAHMKPIKDFSVYEVAEQTAVASALTNERDPKPPAFSAEQHETMEKLGKATGEAFDRAYVEAEIMGHEALLKIQDAFLETHGMKSDHGHIALLAKAVIDMHLSMLDGLKKEVG